MSQPVPRMPMLCVGGPLSGEHRTMLGNKLVHVLQDPLPDVGAWITAVPAAVDAPRTVIYIMDIFRTPQGELKILVPEGQTPLQTMELLLDTYEQAKLRRTT